MAHIQTAAELAEYSPEVTPQPAEYSPEVTPQPAEYSRADAEAPRAQRGVSLLSWSLLFLELIAFINKQKIVGEAETFDDLVARQVRGRSLDMSFEERAKAEMASFLRYADLTRLDMTMISIKRTHTEETVLEAISCAGGKVTSQYHVTESQLVAASEQPTAKSTLKKLAKKFMAPGSGKLYLSVCLPEREIFLEAAPYEPSDFVKPAKTMGYFHRTHDFSGMRARVGAYPKGKKRKASVGEQPARDVQAGAVDRKQGRGAGPKPCVSCGKLDCLHHLQLVSRGICRAVFGNYGLNLGRIFALVFASVPLMNAAPDKDDGATRKGGKREEKNLYLEMLGFGEDLPEGLPGLAHGLLDNHRDEVRSGFNIRLQILLAMPVRALAWDVFEIFLRYLHLDPTLRSVRSTPAEQMAAARQEMQAILAFAKAVPEDDGLVTLDSIVADVARTTVQRIQRGRLSLQETEIKQAAAESWEPYVETLYCALALKEAQLNAAEPESGSGAAVTGAISAYCDLGSGPTSPMEDSAVVNAMKELTNDPVDSESQGEEAFAGFFVLGDSGLMGGFDMLPAMPSLNAAVKEAWEDDDKASCSDLAYNQAGPEQSGVLPITHTLVETIDHAVNNLDEGRLRNTMANAARAISQAIAPLRAAHVAPEYLADAAAVGMRGAAESASPEEDSHTTDSSPNKRVRRS